MILSIMLPTNRILKRKIRLIQSEVKMLQSYYDECLSLLKEYESEYSRDMSYFKGAISGSGEQPDPVTSEATEAIPVESGVYEKGEAGWEKTSDEDAVEPAKIDLNKPAWAKRLYKQIAIATHPDKVAGHSLEQMLVSKFLKAGKAYEEGEFEELVAMALELNIDVGMDDDAMLAMLEKQRSTLKGKITQTESTMAWVWGEAHGDVDLKCKILSSQIEHSMNIDTLKDMISKREKDNAVR